LSVSPSWPLVGVVLILIGLMVRFEVQIDSDDKEEIKKTKEVKGQNGVKS